MNFDEKLKQAIQADDVSIDKSKFLAALHTKQHEADLKRVRLNSSLATVLFLFIFGWVSFTQLGDTYTIDYVYYDEFEFDYFEEMDSLEYELYIDDLALYLLDDDDIFSVLEFFNEVGFEIELHNKGVNL